MSRCKPQILLSVEDESHGPKPSPTMIKEDVINSPISVWEDHFGFHSLGGGPIPYLFNRIDPQSSLALKGDILQCTCLGIKLTFSLQGLLTAEV